MFKLFIFLITILPPPEKLCKCWESDRVECNITISFWFLILKMKLWCLLRSSWPTYREYHNFPLSIEVRNDPEFSKCYSLISIWIVVIPNSSLKQYCFSDVCWDDKILQKNYLFIDIATFIDITITHHSCEWALCWQVRRMWEPAGVGGGKLEKSLSESQQPAPVCSHLIDGRHTSLSSPVKQNVGLLWPVTGWGGSIKTESEEMMYEVIDRVGNVPPAREESCKWHNWSLSDTDTGTIPRGGSGQGLLSPLSPGTLCRSTSWSGGSNSRSICLLQRGNILPASFTWLQLRSVSLSLSRQ